MLRFDRAATVQDTGRSPDRWLSRWHENVSTNDAARLERVLADEMRLAGYAPHTVPEAVVG